MKSHINSHLTSTLYNLAPLQAKQQNRRVSSPIWWQVLLIIGKLPKEKTISREMTLIKQNDSLWQTAKKKKKGAIKCVTLHLAESQKT